MQLPAEFAKEMKAALGNGYSDFISALADAPPVSVRVNPLKDSGVFDKEEKVAWHFLGRYLKDRPSFTLDPLFHAGTYYVQEASSMFLHEAISQTVDLKKRLKVLDLCAAPGGKSTLIASMLNDESLLLANEAIRSRIPVLRFNLEKWGRTNFLVSNHDPTELTGLAGFFDLVLVDAPCSGEGMFRKDASAIDEWSKNNVSLCSSRQKRILKAAVDLVRPGGALIYSTCTFNEFENDQNAKWIIEQNGYENVKLDIPSRWGVATTEHGYQFYPHLVKGEGFYLSIFKKNGGKAFENGKKRANKELLPLGKKYRTQLSEWINQPDQFNYFQKADGKIVLVPASLQNEIFAVIQLLKKRSTGVPIGVFKKNQFIPSHSLALSNAVHPDFQGQDLTKEQAIQYLRKDNLFIAEATKGWQLARYRGFNLGWMKVLDHRINNYFPNEWRIRMAAPK